MKDLFAYNLPLMILSARHRLGVLLKSQNVQLSALEKMVLLSTSWRVARERHANDLLFTKHI